MSEEALRELVIPEQGGDGPPDDVARIVAVAKQHGYLVSPDAAAYAWALYSDDCYAAEWLAFPVSDEEIMRGLRYALAERPR